MLPKFLKPPMNESFVWVAATLKFSGKTGLHSNEGFGLKVHFNGKCLSLTVQGIMRTTLF